MDTINPRSRYMNLCMLGTLVTGGRHHPQNAQAKSCTHCVGETNVLVDRGTHQMDLSSPPVGTSRRGWQRRAGRYASA